MTPTCCAYGCLNKFEKGSGLGFYRFPRQKGRFIRWTLAVRRQNFIPNKHTRICGAHFITGKPSRDKNHVDFVPTLFKFKFPRHTARKFRKKCCDPLEVQVIASSCDLFDEFCVSEDESKPEIKIGEEIHLHSDISIKNESQDIFDSELYNENSDCSTKQIYNADKSYPLCDTYKVVDIQGNVMARFLKKHNKKAALPKKIVNPDSVKIVFENNVARIVADE